MSTPDDMRRLLAGEIDAHEFTDTLGGEPPPPGEPTQPELAPLEWDVSPASQLAGIVLNIADWFAEYAQHVSGVGHLVEGLRGFAGRLTAADPDPAALARDLDTLGWMAWRAYEVYEDGAR